MHPYDLRKNNYRDNPKQNRTRTPAHVADFLASLFPSAIKILDPASGDSALGRPFLDRGAEMIEFELERGQDFLAFSEALEVDLVVCNPPFSGYGTKLAGEVWLDHILKVVGYQTPVVLFTTFGFRLNQRQKSARWKKLRETVKISSIISLPIDVWQDGTEIHAEILVFNASRSHCLQPHYFLPAPKYTSQRAARASRENGKMARSEEAREKMREAWRRRKGVVEER